MIVNGTFAVAPHAYSRSYVFVVVMAGRLSSVPETELNACPFGSMEEELITLSVTITVAVVPQPAGEVQVPVIVML